MAEKEKTRYSDAELEEFRQIILEKLEVAKRDYALYQGAIDNTGGNDTEDTSPTYKSSKTARPRSRKRKRRGWRTGSGSSSTI